MPDTDAIDPIDLSRLERRAHAALEAATSAGADAADAVVVASRAASTTIRNGLVEEAENAEGTDLGLRVFVGERSALVGVGARGDLRAAAERAVAMARAAPPDPTSGLADPSLLSAARDAAGLDLDDAVAVPMDELSARAVELEAAMLSVAGVTKSGGVSASSTRSARWLAASNGFSAGYRTTSHGHGATAIAGDGTRMERDSWGSSRRHLADLMPVAEVGRLAGERAVKRLEAQRLTTRTAAVVFEPRVASGFVGHLLSAVNGTAVSRGASLLAGKLGETVFPETITVRDDCAKVRGNGSRPFDGEGLPAEPIDIVADGILTAYVLDLASARRMGTASNGRAVRGTGLPSPSTSNVTLSGGSGDMHALMRDAGSGLLVTSMFGGGVSIVSGVYSRGVSGFWFEAGEVVHPVAEITIGGTLPDMFLRARWGDDAPGLFTVDAPSVLIEGLTIGGR